MPRVCEVRQMTNLMHVSFLKKCKKCDIKHEICGGTLDKLVKCTCGLSKTSLPFKTQVNPTQFKDTQLKFLISQYLMTLYPVQCPGIQLYLEAIHILRHAGGGGRGLAESVTSLSVEGPNLLS